MKLLITKRGSRWGWLAAGAAALVGAGLLSSADVIGAAPPARPAYLQNFPDFAPNVTPQLPGDVDTALKAQLEAAKKFSQVQREFDLYSWQMFLALNWPTDDKGKPAARITDTGPGLAPAWTLWHNSSSIFQADGSTPQACTAPPAARTLVLRRDLSKPVSRGLKPFSSQAIANADHRQKRFLGVVSAVGELNAANLDDINQAFSGPLIDQNGEFVYYEIMIDPNEVNYLCANKLYNINGQVAFSQVPGQTVKMPWGVDTRDKSGSFELKLAWRILKQGVDDFSRFYTAPAVVIDRDAAGNQTERNGLTVGLVGMHIGHKTASSPQWIWSTFEQIDNLDVDQVAHPNLNPSFFDPNCWICAVNQEPTKPYGAAPRTPTQVWRAIQIPAEKQSLNSQAQAALAQMGPKGSGGSVWQYYQLIDTQWPTVPNPPTPAAWNGGLPDAVANKPGGQPTPVFLTNVTMETYFQGGHVPPPGQQINQMNEAACNGAEVPNNVNCPTGSTASPPVWTSPLNNGTTPVKPGINTLIFATESCMGCHSSAGIYTSYTPNPDPKKVKFTQSGQLTADFSWLLSQKANWFGGPSPVRPLKGKARTRRRG